MKRPSLFILIMVIALLLAPMIASAAPSPTAAALPTVQQQPVKSTDAACALLDDAKARAAMSGMFETKLLLACGRASELGGVASSAPANYAPTFGTDVLVNNPALDSGASRTQSETSIARNESTGTICSAYNDSYGGVTAGTGYTGFSSSTDGGATFTDHGGLGAASFGDPSLIWRKSDGKFYLATLHSSGLGLWRSDNDCTSFTYIGNPHSGSGDDKELLAVDNNAASPYYGRIYMAWIDFNAGARIFVIYSTNGGTTWSAPLAVSASGVDVQGAWPAVAPNGDVYVSWVRWNPYATGPIDIEVVRSTNGGTTFAPVTNPLTGGINPRASAPTASCGRPALNGNIRYLPSPQITVSPNGNLHVVYVRDPDGLNVGDVINVYYRRSTDNGATWGPEVLLNDDGTTTDQFFPTVSAGPGGRIISTWYDRRLDTANNLLFDYYMRASDDGGVTWQASVRVTDGSSGVVLDPNLATCYHGDYDQQIQTAGTVLVQWSDDRQVVNGTDPNVYFDTQAFAPDYTLSVTPDSLSICAPADAAYTVNVGSVLGYTDPVTLAASGNPVGTTTNFSVNPVTPAGSSTLTIGNTGAAAAGSSNITVSATSTSGPKTGDVTLNLYTAAAGQPVLTSPANGATNVPVPPTFTWAASAQAGTYSIQIATDAAFTNIVDQASGLTGTTYTAVAPLNTNTLHYWRVLATNACGDSVYSEVFSFRTVVAPGDCAVGTTANILLNEGFEGGPGGWTSSGTGNSWAISTANPHSGANAFRANDPASVTDQRLVSPAIALPAGQNPVVIKFWHVPNLEPSGTTACYDGGILEATTDGGTTWTQVSSLLVGPYTGPVSGSFGNPLAGLNAWCGTTSYINTIADVSAYAGQTAQFRMRLGSDNSVNNPGWDVDDVTVQSCEPAVVDPNIDVSPLSLASAQATNTTTSQPLTVANTGGGTLNWQIAEEPVDLPQMANLPGYAPGAPAVDDAAGSIGAAPAVPANAPTWRWPAVVLYDNGPLVNSPGTGPGGADESLARDVTVGLVSRGFNHSLAADYRVADDFTITDPGGWNVSSITFFPYMGNSPTTPSPISGINFQIWDGPPDQGTSSVVFGDTTTNRLTSTTFANIYRRLESQPTDATRPVFGSVATAGTILAPGTYWLDWQADGDINYTGPWAPPITIDGQTSTGNALQSVAGVWQPVVDTSLQTTLGLPFVIEGTVVSSAACANPANVGWLSVNPISGSNAGGTNTPVTVTFDSTGLAVGVYTANLCVDSDDPDPGPGNGTDQVIVPVTLTVQPPTAVALTGLAADVAQSPAPLAGLPLAALPAAAAAALGAAFVWRRQRD